MDLLQVLRLQRNARLALVGAGGKTTALFQLARAFEPPVIVTASTHLGEWQAGFADRHLIVTHPVDSQKLERVLESAGRLEGVTLLTGSLVGERRLEGLDAPTLEILRSLADRLNIPLLIEADGSRQRPLKAPAENEPAIPEWVNGVIVVAGLSGLGQPLDEAIVHRPELFATLSELEMEQPVTANALAQVLSSPEGGLKNIPLGARAIALLNQADEPERVSQGRLIADRLVGPFDSIIVAALEQRKIHAVVEPTAGVVLAAGAAERYGEPKQLLPWRGKPLVRHAAEVALASGLWPVIVVLGAYSHRVRDVLEDLPVTFVDNSNWRDGQSTSVIRAVEALPASSGSAVFLLGDQPAVVPELVRQLKERHYQTMADVVAPRVAGQRCSPVLFDRNTFNDLLSLKGDTGGRAIINSHEVEDVIWEDTNLLLDIDTPEDYQKLQGLG